MRHLNRQSRRPEALVESLRALVPDRIEICVNRADRLAVQALQELMHGAHDVRMGVERAARQADIGRAILAKPPHELAATADGADGQAPPSVLP